MGDEMRQITACFTGHRQITEPVEDIRIRVASAVEGLIQRGYSDFEAGGARGFDAVASEVILEMKAAYPHIRLVLILPFDEQYRHEKEWSQAEIEQYHDLKANAAEVVSLAASYSAGAYYRRNKRLVDDSSVCIAYQRRANSGAGYTVKYAESKGLEIINVAQSKMKGVSNER